MPPDVDLVLCPSVSRLIEIEEAIDGLEAAIDYRNDTISHRQQELRKSVSISVVRPSRSISLALPHTHSLSDTHTISLSLLTSLPRSHPSSSSPSLPPSLPPSLTLSLRPSLHLHFLHPSLPPLSSIHVSFYLPPSLSIPLPPSPALPSLPPYTMCPSQWYVTFCLDTSTLIVGILTNTFLLFGSLKTWF